MSTLNLNKEITKISYNDFMNLSNKNGKYFILEFNEIRCLRYNKLHCVNGPAVEYPDGTKEWFLNGKLHRENGPAVEFANGDKHWYINGKTHREDGPAIKWSDGYEVWYYHGTLINCSSQKEFEKLIKLKSFW